MKNFTRLLILLAVLVSGLYIGFQLAAVPKQNAAPQPKTEAVIQYIKVNLKLNFSDDNIKNFPDISVEDGETVFSLLEKVTKIQKIDLKYKDYGGEMGVFIESIGENANDLKGNKYWQFWVNNEYSKTGPSSYKLKDGDNVEWKFTEGQISN